MNVKAIVSGIVILGAIGLGIFVSSSAGKNFYTVEQFLDLPQAPHRAVKIRGIIVEDTLRETGTTIDFVVRDPESGTDRTLPVHFDVLTAAGQRPDTLMPKAEVVLEGRLAEGGVFEATTILSKCPSKYEEQRRAASEVPGQAGS